MTCDTSQGSIRTKEKVKTGPHPSALPFALRRNITPHHHISLPLSVLRILLFHCPRSDLQAKAHAKQQRYQLPPSPLPPSLSFLYIYTTSTMCQPLSNKQNPPLRNYGRTWHKANVFLKNSKLNKWQPNHTLNAPIKHDLYSWVLKTVLSLEAGNPLATWLQLQKRWKLATCIEHLLCTRNSAMPFSGILTWLSHIHKNAYVVVCLSL